MCHAHSDVFHAASGRARSGGHGHHKVYEVVARSAHKKARLPASVLLAALVLAVLGNVAHASDRITLLRYICATYESARQVALEQGWERPESMPGDCRTLFRRGYEGRIAQISQIMEVVSIGDGRWVEIGRVRRGFAETGYSAGIAEQLLLF
jgi:hypothetical protein